MAGNNSSSNEAVVKLIEMGFEEASAVQAVKKRLVYPSLKSFQKKALDAWVDNQDYLVLAATGSGKSMFSDSSLGCHIAIDKLDA